MLDLASSLSKEKSQQAETELQALLRELGSDRVDAAKALVELLEFDHGGVLHLAGPDRVTRHELGLAVMAAMGLEPAAARAEIEEARQADLDAGAPRPRDVSLDARLAARHLETGLHGVEAGMARAVAP